MSPREALATVLGGYTALLRSVLGLVLALAAAGGVSALVAWPLWLAATSQPRLYALGLGAGLACLALVLGLGARSRRSRPGPRSPGSRRLLRRFSLLALALASLPTLALSLRAPAFGLPLLALIALLAGFPLFVGRRA